MKGLVAGYASSGDEASSSDEEPAKPQRAQVREGPGAGQRQSKWSEQARAILPPEIRAALEGDAAWSDDEAAAAPPATAAPKKVHGGARGHALLAALPAPEHATKAPPEPFIPPPLPAAVDSDDSDDGGPPVDSFFSLPVAGARARRAAAPVVADGGPPVDSFFSLPVAGARARRAAAPVAAAAAPPAGPLAGPRRPAAPPPLVANPYAPPPAPPPPARSAARRRRDAEAALAKGDVSAFARLQGATGVVVADVAPRVETRSNDQLLAASDRRNPEVQIAAAFYNTKSGATTTTTRASKTQKRKHQINSLAIAAAERELELLEKRGRASKTKKETNAKYGW